MASSPRLPKSKLPSRPVNNYSTSGMATTAAADLNTIDPKGNAPDERLPESGQAHRLYIKLMDGDRASAYNRTLLERVVDGEAPYNESMIRSTGMGWRYNLNFLEADSMTSAALTSYDDLVDSVDDLFTVRLKPNSLPNNDLEDAEDVISEEATTLVRHDWPQFPSYWTRLATQIVGHGVGFVYQTDAEDWRWRPAGWADFLMPRKTEATEEAVSILIGHRNYPVHELWDKIKDAPEDSKWNKDEVKKAIVKARFGTKRLKVWQRWWSEIEQDLKNNDLVFGLADAEEVECLHYWVREFDGSYSFYIGLAGGENADYLYRDPHRYEKANQAFTIFTFGVGKGTYHSIRGLWYKMYPFVQVLNRLRSQVLDQAALNGALLLQPADGESEEEMSITLTGPVGYIPSGAQVIQRQFPNVGSQSMPVINDLSMQLENATGQFRPQSVSSTNPQVDETKYGVQARQQATGTLNSSSIARFYRALDAVFAEQFRRIQNIGPNSTRYPEVTAFYERCAERGVPSDIIKKAISRVTATRAIGNGSPQVRMAALDQLQQMAGSLDETGRSNATRDAIAARFGRAMADRYRPKANRIAPDQKVAEMENVLLRTAPIQPDPDENHAVHLQVHVPAFMQLVQQLTQLQKQQPDMDFRQVRDQVQYASALQDHCSPHVQGLAADPARVPQSKAYAAALEQGGNLLAAFARQIDAKDRQDQQAQQATQQAGGDPQNPSQPQGDPDMAIKAKKAEFDMQLKQQSVQFDQQLKARDLMERLRLKGIETDAKVRNQIVSNGARSATPTSS